MHPRDISNIIKRLFEHEPTTGQHLLIDMLAEFLNKPTKNAFIIKGYAGTGKTTVVSALV